MTLNPYITVDGGSYVEFESSLEGSNADLSHLLYRSMANKSLVDRVKIATLLLRWTNQI